MNFQKDRISRMLKTVQLGKDAYFCSIRTKRNYYSLISNKFEPLFTVELPGHKQRHRGFGSPLYRTRTQAKQALLLYILLTGREGSFTKKCLSTTNVVYLFVRERRHDEESYCIVFRDGDSYFVTTEANPYNQTELVFGSQKRPLSNNNDCKDN